MIIPALMGTLRPASVVADPYTMLLCHFNGADGSTTMTDAMGRHTPTRQGDAQIDTAQSVFGGASLLCDGTGDYVSVAASSDFVFGSGDWTVDMRIRFNALATNNYILSVDDSASLGAGAIMFYANAAGNLLMGPDWTGSSSWILSGSGGVTTGTWYHLALVRNGTTVTAYKDGTSFGTPVTPGASALTAYDSTAYIGARGNASHSPINGWIDELRISNIARWTSNFTPPTSEYSP